MGVFTNWRALMLAIAIAASVAVPSIAIAFGPVAGAIVFFTQRPIRLRLDATNIAVIVYGVFVAASLLWSAYPMTTLRTAIDVAAFGILFIAVRIVTTRATELRLMAAAYLAGCVILVARFLVQAAFWPPKNDSHRLHLVDVNANYAAYALAAGLAVAVLLWATGDKTRREALTLGILGVTLVGGILLLETRSALISVGLLAIWLLICKVLPHPPIKSLVAVASVSAAAITLGLIDTASLAIESLLGRPTGDWSGRLLMWPVAREAWLENPLVGSGAGTFIKTAPFEAATHNLILELGTGLGIIGVALFLSVLWFALRRRDALLVGCFIAVSASSYLTGSWDTAAAAWALLAIFASLPVRPTKTVIASGLEQEEALTKR